MPEPATETLGQRMRRLREARGMNRSDLSKATAEFGRTVEGHTIWYYEDDQYEPKIRSFAAIAQALGVTMDDLWYGTGDAAPEA